MSTNQIRRSLLRVGSMAVLPLLGMSRLARAGANAALRTQFRYQAEPLGEKNCASCLEFIPGKSDTALGGCKRIPGDDQISPQGYCVLWNML
ncbi:MAG: hypothetical protein ACM3X0_11530 [Bacteroidota bacterium]